MGTANQSEHQIAYMVNRFLQWKLPKDFQPDCGIHFDANAAKRLNPNNHTYEPVGTNLLSADQAKEMVRFMIDGLPDSIRRNRPAQQIPTSHRILASRLLDLAADKFHEHGCNDMDPEAFEDLEPKEIKELVDGFNAWRRGETGETCGDSDDPKLACGEIGDDMWMAYLSAVIGRQSSIEADVDSQFTEEQKVAIAKAIFDNDYSEMKRLKGLGRWLKSADSTVSEHSEIRSES